MESAKHPHPVAIVVPTIMSISLHGYTALLQSGTASANPCAHPLRSRLRYALRRPHTTLLPRLFVPLARHAGRVQCVRLRAALRLHCGGGSGPGYDSASLPQCRRGGAVVPGTGGAPPPVRSLRGFVVPLRRRRLHRRQRQGQFSDFISAMLTLMMAWDSSSLKDDTWDSSISLDSSSAVTIPSARVTRQANDSAVACSSSGR